MIEVTDGVTESCRRFTGNDIINKLLYALKASIFDSGRNTDVHGRKRQTTSPDSVLNADVVSLVHGLCFIDVPRIIF